MERDPSILFSDRDELCARLIGRRDEEGRPACAEGFLSDPEFQRIVETRRCPYPGGRRDGSMNLSALRQLSTWWEEILCALGLLRDRLLAVSGAPALNLWEIRCASVAGVSLPGYFFFRAREPLGDGELPSFLSATSKILFDVVTLADGVAEEWLRSGTFARRIRGSVDTGLLLDAAEASGALLGPRGVCAAPPHMLREALDALSRPRRGRGAAAANLARALGDLGALFRYADAFTSMDLARSYFRSLAIDGVAALREALAEVDSSLIGADGARLLEAAAAPPDDPFAQRSPPCRRATLEVLERYLAQVEGGELPDAPLRGESVELARWAGAMDASEPVRRTTLAVLLDAARIERAARAGFVRRAARVSRALGWEEGPGPLRRRTLVKMLGASALDVVRRAMAARGAASGSALPLSSHCAPGGVACKVDR